jgi:hypothetical protein
MTRQVQTYSCSAKAIMRHPNFAVGFADARAGRPFNCDIDDTHWAYERGRLLGTIMPPSMSLRDERGKFYPEAVALFEAAIERRLIP